MSKLLRKSVSVFIAFAIVLSCFAGINVFAEEETCPYIYIHGFMAQDIIADKNDSESEVLWPPEGSDILDTVKQCLPDLLKFLVTRNYRKLGDAIIGPAAELLSKANLDINGEPSDGSGVYFAYPPASSITKSSHLKFRYDWRLDPIELASQLNDYIEYVVRASGSEQVVIECHSFGGIVAETYLQLYGGDRIKSVCYNTTAIYGETYTGELMSGVLYIDPDAVTEYIRGMLSENERAELIGMLLDVMNDAGVTDDLSSILNGIVENLGDELKKEILLPMFAGWLSIWAMIPDDYVDASIDYVFNELYKDDGLDHSGLREKVDNYNEMIRPFKTETLLAQNETANVYVVSRYGYATVPLTEKWKLMTDTVVDTAFSSMGGTCADYGSAFADDFVSRCDPAYLNVDKTVYAATCLFPDQTWFVRDLTHAKSPSSLENFMSALLYYDGQADINTFAEYPQYLVYDYADGSLSPDEGTPAAEKTFFEKLFDFYRMILRFFRRIIDFIF